MKRSDGFKISENFAKVLVRFCGISIIMMATPVIAQDISVYRVYDFLSDYHRYHVGDVAPNTYFTPEYRIDKWKIRHLPPPEANTRWSFMCGTYVLLNEGNHKIVKAYNSDIFYKTLP